ncbi:unnamed protein product [Hymenolepis diminuta]|uniref:Uncharacterized protein n=1 Tax=Hymenolepis diminuta TaxID=6216 RepID=A0A564YIK7_HYMDI|nr:unnamed protein product [Hymenolepis diminuta]
MISRPLTTQTRRVCSLTPEQPLIPERNYQDINPHVPQGLDDISLISRSISRQGRVIGSANEHITYKKIIFFPKYFLYVRFLVYHLLIPFYSNEFIYITFVNGHIIN